MKKWLKLGTAVGIGATGYWLTREFLKSDRTPQGMWETLRADVVAGSQNCVTSVKRFYAAIQAGARNWAENPDGQWEGFDSVGENPSGLGNRTIGKPADLPKSRYHYRDESPARGRHPG